MNRILVTGATGLVGRHLLASLSEKHQIFALTSQPVSSQAKNIAWIQHDLTTPSLPDQLPKEIDTIIYLAQSPHFREFPDQALNIFEVNVGGTIRLLDWAKTTGVKRFIYASSGGIYGHGEQDFSEGDTIDAKDTLGFYLASKQCSELLIEPYSELVNMIILRFFFVYGPGQRDDMLIPRLIQQVAQNQPIFLQGDYGLRINPIHVDDAVRALEQCLIIHGNHKINIAGPETLTLQQIGEIMGGYLNQAPNFKFEPDKKPSHLVGNISKMERLLGAPKIRFRQGVQPLCEHVVKCLQQLDH